MENEIEIFKTLFESPVDVAIRIPKKIAAKWLLENKSIITCGNVFYFKIVDIGLGVCKISKAPLGCRETYLQKS